MISKNITQKVLIFTMILCIILSSNTPSYAHPKMLEVVYDDCVISYNDRLTPEDEGEDEIWYYTISHNPLILNNNGEELLYLNYARHLDHETTTIKYFFEDSSQYDVNYTWTTDIYKTYLQTMSEEEALLKAEETAEQIKKDYANSMKKWNNIYYYSYDENGNRISNKVINIVEGTQNDHNLSIYPVDYYNISTDESDDSFPNIKYVACVDAGILSYNVQEIQTNPYHLHCYDGPDFPHSLSWL